MGGGGGVSISIGYKRPVMTVLKCYFCVEMWYYDNLLSGIRIGRSRVKLSD